MAKKIINGRVYTDTFFERVPQHQLPEECKMTMYRAFLLLPEKQKKEVEYLAEKDNVSPLAAILCAVDTVYNVVKKAQAAEQVTQTNNIA